MVRGPRPSRKGTGRRRRGDADSGAEETRTPDVLLAKEVLYQLSYGPDANARGRTVGRGPQNAPRFGRLALLANDVSEPASDTDQPAKPAQGYNVEVQTNPSGRFWTRTRGLCLIRAVL